MQAHRNAADIFVLQTSGKHLNRKRDTLDFLLNGLKCWYLATHTAHAFVQSPTPGSLYRHTTKQFSHSSRRFNCSNSRRFEILGHPHRCACATKGFVLCHSLPPAPGLADSKAPEPFSTLWPSSPQVWEENKHNSMKSAYSFTVLQPDGTQRKCSLCAVWLDLDPPPTTTPF